jgi:hypothetical protein
MNSTERSPAYQWSLQFRHRESKRLRIVDIYLANIGRRISSPWLHGEFGSSFRSRVREINDDAACPILIRNQNFYDEAAGVEVSHYWGELRPRHRDLG